MAKEKPCDIVILGTGNLAQELISAISTAPDHTFTVCIAGRSEETAASLAFLGNVRARISGSKSFFFSSLLTWSDEGLTELLNKCYPKVIIHLSSLQSPWTLSDKSEWSSLVSKFGFGITAPLQLHLLFKLTRVIEKESLNSIVINACYPDACNAILAMSGYQVLCGVGNVSILEAIIKHCYHLRESDSIDIVGHHFHISQLISRKDSDRLAFPEVLINGSPPDLLHEKLSQLTLPSDSSLNRITAFTILPLLDSIMLNKEKTINIPGPLGLPGGYPVSVKGHQIELRLPDQWKRELMVERNTTLCAREGIGWSNGVIFLDDVVIRYLKRNYPELEVLNKLDFLAA